MPISINKVVDYAAAHPWAIAGGAAVGLGATSGFKSGQATKSQAGGDTDGYVESRALRGAVIGAAAVGVAGAAYSARDLIKPAAKGLASIGAGIGNFGKSYMTKAFEDAAAQPEILSKIFSRGPVAMLAGAAVGGLATAYSEDDPRKGLAIGAAAGAVGTMIHRGKEIWDMGGKFWHGGILLAGAGVIAMGARAMSPDAEPWTEGVAESDGAGGYQTRTVRDRMRDMGASGDIVFGLHNSR